MKIFAAIISSIVICLSLAACGGGGGTGGGGSASPLGTAPSSPQGSANGSITITKTSLIFNETTAVSALFKKSDGTPAAGASVTFSTTLGILTPTTAVTTDANGIATVQLTVGSVSGSGQVTASATVDGKLISNNAQFSVNLPPLNLSPITLGLSILSYGGSTSVAVTVKDANGNPFTTQDVDVVFTSTQAASGKASLNTPVRTIKGVATTTYKAISATGTDTITASIAGASVTSDIVITPLNAGSITFVSATPANISLKSMGGLGYQQTSTVVFKVLDTAGLPRPNQSVDFTLSTSVGGLSLSQFSGSTAGDGTISTIVQAGNVATPVRVKATITGSNPSISTQSDQLVVSTGIPAQDGMSVAFSTLNSESYYFDGVTTDVTAFLADHFGNPVPDGTAVSFSAQVGLIDPSCTTGSNGSPHGVCSVKWRSAGQRTSDGINAILVYAIGEESFVDLNGNGLADGVCAGTTTLANGQQCGEFRDMPQAWRDDAHTGIYNALIDPFIDFNSSGKVDSDGKFNGVLVANPAGTTLKHVFKNPKIVMSTGGAIITVSAGNPIDTNPKTITFTVTDKNTNVMPAGTTINLTATTGTLSTSSFVVPNTTTAPGAISVVWSTTPATPAVATTGSVTITVSTPAGVVTTSTIPISGNF
jgi:Bacterial Ig-like domain (group 1)